MVWAMGESRRPCCLKFLFAPLYSWKMCNNCKFGEGGTWWPLGSSQNCRANSILLLHLVLLTFLVLPSVIPSEQDGAGSSVIL